MPLCPGRCSLTCCRPSDRIHKQLQIQNHSWNNCSSVPLNRWVYLLQTIWKSKETNGSDFDITVVVWFKKDLIKYWFESHQIINAYLVVHYQVISGNKYNSCFLCCCLFTLMDDNYIPTRALSSALQFAILFLLQ